MLKSNIQFNYYEFTDEDIENIIDTYLPFIIKDLVSISKEKIIIEITSVFTQKELRRQNSATKALQELLTLLPDDRLICLTAGASVLEYEYEPDNEEYDKLFIILNNFYEKNNFLNINELFGIYDGHTQQAFIYLNDKGIEIVNTYKSTLEPMSIAKGDKEWQPI